MITASRLCTSERARFRCYAEQRLACVNADGAARLVLSFKNHIRRRGGTVVRTARDLRLPQVPEAPVDTHRPREATAVDSAEATIVPACPNFTTGAHAILAHLLLLPLADQGETLSKENGGTRESRGCWLVGW